MMNNVCIIGRLVAETKLRYTTNNKAVSEFTIACSRIPEGTDFIKCQVWGKQAENLEKYTEKGSLISINGKLRTDEFNDKEGNKKAKTYVLANEIEYLTKANKGQKIKEAINTIEESTKTDPFEDFGNEIDNADLPF